MSDIITPIRIDWNKFDLGEAYDLVEGVRRAAAQDTESPIDSSLRAALDSIEAADCEWDGLTRDDSPSQIVTAVIQSDRDAAADLVERYHPHSKGMQRLARSIRVGSCDSTTFTQAFANYRLLLAAKAEASK